MENTTFKKRLLEILLHSGVWIILFIIPNYLLSLRNEQDVSQFGFILYRTLFFAIAFYLNYFLLIPYLFFRKRKLTYFIAAIAMVVVVFLVSGLLMKKPPPPDLCKPEKNQEFSRQQEPTDRPPPPPKLPGDYNTLLMFLLIAGSGLGIRFSEKHRKTEQIRKETEKERLNAELALLKSQINPHFFFNTLNNIYTLAEYQSKDAPGAILKLSKLMRYVMHDPESGTTLLSKEIEFLQNYIDLMKLRLSPKVKLYIGFQEEYTDVEVPPLLFIPFIENAFKYGISYTSSSFIHVQMMISEGSLVFECKNSIASDSHDNPEFSTGLGLENVVRRLEMLYPGKHNLEITKDDGVFDVKLTLNTS
ncbi:MAG: histidine kinase [Bacteroidetes bacterium]|nr:histidine kinase [Bacteroidota bacterium]MBU1717982.1 histidine kinase [Bacteroidota bacterium]